MSRFARRVDSRSWTLGAFHFIAAAAACFWLALPASTSQAQTYDATNVRQPTDLSAIWLLQAGDDPDYARASFDDSSWKHFDARTTVTTVFPGHKPEVLWYRLHVKVLPTQTGLALAEYQLASAFEIFVNGRRIMQNGQVAPFVPYTYAARLIQRIPDSEVSTGSMVIALRVHISRNEWGDTNPGLFAPNLTLGQERVLWEHIWLTIIGQNAFFWFNEVSGLGLGIVALALFTTQRRQLEYLWIFLQFFASACTLPWQMIELFRNVPANWNLFQEPLVVATVFFSVLMYFAILRLRFGWWIRAICGIASLGLVVTLIGVSQGSLPRNATGLGLFPFVFLVAGVIPVLLVLHLRRGNREAGILLIPVILSSFAIYAAVVLAVLSGIPAFTSMVVRLSTLVFNFPVGPFTLSLIQVASLLYILSLAVIMVLRSARMGHQQALLEGEVAAAREVQRIILPERLETVPGFTLESAYQPAQQVGGDFFQALPAGQGRLLVVVGDVAGKGLPAAMLVSVLVGAIRGVADYTTEPAEVLGRLNEQLIGREGGGFSTALAARFEADGEVTIANAGHLSPYMDGKELHLPGALPLGADAHATYQTLVFHLAPGSRLAFFTDGVVEARSPKGELFGFERGEAISNQPAATIVETARLFGQSDDITVVIVERNAEVAASAA